MLRNVLAVLIMAIPLACHATSAFTGKILKIHSGPGVGTKVFLVLDGDQNNKASCSTSTTYNYVFDGSTDGGKIYLSMALSSYAAGKDVYVGGYQTCSLYSNTEDLKWIRVQ